MQRGEPWRPAASAQLHSRWQAWRDNGATSILSRAPTAAFASLVPKSRTGWCCASPLLLFPLLFGHRGRALFRFFFTPQDGGFPTRGYVGGFVMAWDTFGPNDLHRKSWPRA